MPLFRVPYAFYNGFYFRGNLSDAKIEDMEKLLEAGQLDNLQDIIPGITLRKGQTLAVALAYINKRFFFGDKPGLGKTVMASATILLCKKIAIKKNIEFGKILMVTTSEHLRSMAKEMGRYGINLLVLEGNTTEVRRLMKKTDFSQYNGIAIAWPSIQTNGFTEFFLEYQNEFEKGMIVYDETSILKNEKTKTYKVAKELSSLVDRVIMLNGSIFETHIMDIFNQFAVLIPIIKNGQTSDIGSMVMPTKSYINQRYVVWGSKSFEKTDFHEDGNGRKVYGRFTKEVPDIIGYQNQDELRKRLRYHFISRSKRDFADGKDIPEHNYILVPVEMNGLQKGRLEESWRQYNTILNSPTTSFENDEFTEKLVPKYKKLLDLTEELIDEKPVIFVWHIEAQNHIANKLTSMGYKVGMINSKIDKDTREQYKEDFNEGKLDALIINTFKAINLPHCNTMIFYNTITNPQLTYQAMARIDRDNYDTVKTYYFLVYNASPEVYNMRDLSLFREINANLFTGTEETVYKQLTEQLKNLEEMAGEPDASEYQLRLAIAEEDD